MLAAAVAHNSFLFFVLPVKLNRWEFCVSQEGLSLALALETQKKTEE